MLKIVLWVSATAIFIWPSICPAAEAPQELAGFTLGGKILDHKDRIKPDSVLPVRYLESLKEVEAKEIWGYKTGLISYTTCVTPPRIARIKLKYADASKAFYDALLKRFRKRFGEPDEYRGDPFHVVIAWKWAFMDKNNNDISLILQHNTRDEEEKQGNSIKLTMWNLFKQEIRCFEKRHPESAGSERPAFRFSKTSSIDWDSFIPQ
ncbi:MAG: hypothetical protein PVJ82_00220 [Desulfobacteraceae bacterium]|jgi:hypothetical protein